MSFQVVHMLTLSRPGGHIVHPSQNHKMSSEWLVVWSFGFVTFLFMEFQFHQSAIMYLAMGAIQLFSIILKTQTSIVFQVFPPDRNFL